MEDQEVFFLSEIRKRYFDFDIKYVFTAENRTKNIRIADYPHLLCILNRKYEICNHPFEIRQLIVWAFL